MIDLEHEFFDYISYSEKQEIKAEINAGQSRIFSLYNNFTGELQAGFILTAYRDKIHIREIGGAYVWATKFANEFAEKIARAMKINKVSFTAHNATIQKRCKIYGFEPSKEYANEFERVF